MKGKVILTPITNPVEGMQVVTTYIPDEVVTISSLNPKGDLIEEGDVQLKTQKGKFRVAHKTKLRQIAVEYWSLGDPPSCKTVLSLHPDQWNVGIALIGHECEFEIEYGDGEIFVSNPKYPQAFKYTRAKLLLPTPVRTINDIPEELRKNYPADFDGNDSNFWIKRHMENVKLLDEKDKEILQLVKNNNDLKDRCEKLELQQSTPVEESWDDIFNKAAKERGSLVVTSLMYYLKTNFSPPKRKV